MLKALRESVLEANLELKRRGIVLYTWGSVSGIDRDAGLVVIKPSGVSYDEMTADDMAVVNLDITLPWGTKKPSSDTKIHTALYRAFPEIAGVVHTQSTHAVGWAQARPMVLLAGHGPFAWGRTPDDAVHNAVVLERCAEMATVTRMACSGLPPLEDHVLDYHYQRKPGKYAWYGQK